MTKLSDVVDTNQFLPEFEKPDNFIGKLMMLHKFDFRKGSFGVYAVMTLSEPTTGAQHIVSCGAMRVVMCLKALEAMPDVEYPVEVTFIRIGRAITLQ